MRRLGEQVDWTFETEFPAPPELPAPQELSAPPELPDSQELDKIKKKKNQFCLFFIFFIIKGRVSPSSDKGGDLEAEKAIFPEMECKAKSNCSAMSCFVMIQEDKSGGVVSVSLSLCFLVLVVKSEDGPRCLLVTWKLRKRYSRRWSARPGATAAP